MHRIDGIYNKSRRQGDPALLRFAGRYRALAVITRRFACTA